MGGSTSSHLSLLPANLPGVVYNGSLRQLHLYFWWGWGKTAQQLRQIPTEGKGRRRGQTTAYRRYARLRSLQSKENWLKRADRKKEIEATLGRREEESENVSTEGAGGDEGQRKGFKVCVPATSDTNFCAANATSLMIRSSLVATPLLMCGCVEQVCNYRNKWLDHFVNTSASARASRRGQSSAPLKL